MDALPLQNLAGLFQAGSSAHRQWLEGGLAAFTHLAQALSKQAAPLASGAWWPHSGDPGHPEFQGLERTFGALADAFGLAPSKVLRDAWREMLVADEQRRSAQTEYFALLATAWNTTLEGVATRLAEMAGRGERVDTLMGLVRLVAGIADQNVHQAMQSEAGLKATSDCIRGSLRYRQQRNRLVEVTSEMLNVPTRAEVDEAYREIQDLKRQVRELKRSIEGRSKAPRSVAKRNAKEVSHGQQD